LYYIVLLKLSVLHSHTARNSRHDKSPACTHPTPGQTDQWATCTIAQLKHMSATHQVSRSSKQFLHLCRTRPRLAGSNIRPQPPGTNPLLLSATPTPSESSRESIVEVLSCPPQTCISCSRRCQQEQRCTRNETMLTGVPALWHCHHRGSWPEPKTPIPQKAELVLRYAQNFVCPICSPKTPIRILQSIIAPIHPVLQWCPVGPHQALSTISPA
jgi:hypothetical protein